MMKMKPPPPSPSCASSSGPADADQLAEIETLRRELDARKRQLRKLLQQKAEEVRRALQTERQRSVRSLSSLRERLHQEKLAELAKQKDTLARSFELQLQKISSSDDERQPSSSERLGKESEERIKPNDAFASPHSPHDRPDTNHAPLAAPDKAPLRAELATMEDMQFIDEEEEDSGFENAKLTTLVRTKRRPCGPKMGDFFCPEANRWESPPDVGPAPSGAECVAVLPPTHPPPPPPTSETVTIDMPALSDSRSSGSSSDEQDGRMAGQVEASSEDAMYAKMADLLSQLRHQEDENYQLAEQLKKMESLQSSLEAKNRDYCRQNVELISANRKLSSKVKALTANNTQMKQELDTLIRQQLQQQLLQQQQQQQEVTVGPWYLHPPKDPSPPHHVIEATPIEEEEEDEEEPQVPSPKKMSPWRTSLVPWSSKERWWGGDSPSSASMAPIIEEEEESDWWEEKTRLNQENLALSVKVNALEQLQAKLEAELRETRDQNELQEFRILELEECTSTSSRECQDASTNTNSIWDSPSKRELGKSNSYNSLDEGMQDSFKDEKLEEILGKLQVLLQEWPLELSPKAEGLLAKTIPRLVDLGYQLQKFKGSPEPDWWLDGPHQGSGDDAPDKVHRLEDYIAALRLENKHLSMKVMALEKQLSMLLSSGSRDSPTEVSDSRSDIVSQGGETGYSSDDSIDAEELYHLSVNGGSNMHSPSLSLDGSESHIMPFRLEYEDILHKISGLNVETSDLKIGEGLWKVDLAGRMKHLESSESKLKEDVDRLMKQNEKLRMEKDSLQQKCHEMEKVENHTSLDEQTAQSRLQAAYEVETSLRESIEKLEKKDQQQSDKMAALEQAKVELEHQVNQLSKAVESYVKKINTLEHSQDIAEHSVDEPVPNSPAHDANYSNIQCCADRDRNVGEAHTPQSVKSECSIMSENLKNLFPDDSIVVSSFASFQGVADFSRPSFCNGSEKLSGAMTNSLLQLSSDSVVNSNDCANLLFVYVDDSDASVDSESVKFDGEKLNKLFTEKEKELRRKEAEYLLKMEALKCDHDETVMRLEGRLEAVLKSEVELREQVETLLAVKKSLEVNLKKLDREAEMEKTSLVSQIDVLQCEKAKLENKLREHVAPSTSRLYIGCEEVYEDRDEIVERSYSPSKIKEGAHRKKIRDLENHLQLLRMEVEQPSSLDSLPQCDASSTFKVFEQVDGNLREKLHDLSRSESRLRQRIFELEKKEVAYRETLHEADKIMSDVEQSYQERVEELELSEEKLRARIVQLEQSEKRLRQALRNSNRNSEVAKFGELLDRLLETEASEQRLKGRIHELQQIEAELKQRLSSTERERLSVEGELKDQEELVQSVLDLKRTETELRARVEELETSESALRETLSQADVILAERESDLQHKVEELETELENMRQTNCELKDNESRLSSNLDEKEQRLALLEKKVYDEHDDDESCEASSEKIVSPPSVLVPTDADVVFTSTPNRSTIDVDPRRARIMTEILEENVRLELQTLEVQNTNEKLRKQLLEAESRNAYFRSESNAQHESKADNTRYLEMNLELLAKNSRIESLQDRIRALEAGNLPAELQTLSLHGDELKELKEKINSMSAFVQNCNCCNCSNCQPLLHDIESQIELLDAIISGSCSPLEMREDQNNQEVLVTGLGNFSKDMRVSNKKDVGFTNGKSHSDETPVTENEEKEDPKTTSVDNVGSSSPILTTNLNRSNSSSLVAPVTTLPNSPKNKKHPPPVPPKPPTPLHLLHLRKQQNKTEELVRVLRHQTTQLENELLSKKKELQDASEEITKLHSRLRLKEKEAKEGSIAQKQMRDLEHKVMALNKQVRLLEQSHHDNNSLREKVQELETELQKRKGNERKLYAENLHLHHKVEAQRERMNSLQVIKKDYKSMMTKYETLEKKSKKAEQAVTPLKTRVVQLTKKCKERDEEINRLNRQNLRNSTIYSPGRRTRTNKRSDEESSVEDMEMVDDSCVCVFNALRNGLDMGLSDLNSSSTSSENYDTAISHHSNNCSPRRINGPKSRIPRFTALSSPLSSPRSRQSLNELVSSQPSDSSPRDIKSRPSKVQFLSSPRLQSGLRETPVIQPSRRRTRHTPADDGPEPPSNFRVTRQVGQDSLLVAWTVPQPDTDATREDKRVSGYQIFVNGQLQPKVRSADRTKALLNSLDLSQRLDITIHSVCESGLKSVVARTTYTASDAIGYSDDSDMSSPPLSARSLDDKDLNQNVIKRKCLVRHDYVPRMHSPNQPDPSFELLLRAGDLVTVFGQSQANGFYYGEASGQRGLIFADAVEELPSRKLSGSRVSTERSIHTD